MKKLISTQSKKNSEKVRKRLEGVRVAVAIPGEIRGETSGADALLAGHRLLAEARAQEALTIAQQLLSQIDDVVDIYLLKARALLDLEALYELHLLIDPLLEAAPGNHGVLMVASRYYYLIGQAKQSLVIAAKALRKDPRNVEALLQMELCYRYSGNTGEASRILYRCLELSRPKQSGDIEEFKRFSAALFRLANYELVEDSWLAELETIYANMDDPHLESQAAYALAIQYKKREDRTSEVKYLRAANILESRALGLDTHLDGLEASYERRYERQRSVFPTSNPGWLSNIDNSSHAPVFVLGLPRSGTTLLEQILGAHSAIGQVGESKAFLHALRKACHKVNSLWSYSDYPSYIDRLSEQSQTDLVNVYELHQAVLTDKTIYIDKELANFEYVGLMATLLPKARFIHMDRAPMDIFLSCFRNSIPGIPEAADLRAMAQYYVYMKRLIGYWKSLFSERLQIINYQTLVYEPEKTARQAADFVGVDFEPNMLAFHERKNIVRTLSVDQVRKKIYTSSVEGWRKYSEVLTPALKVLEEHEIPVEGVAYI